MRWWGRGVVRRSSWLMVGAAIGLAAVALAAGLAQVLAPVLPGPDWPLLVLLLLAIPLLGLLPGIRDLEVTAARSLLGVEDLMEVDRHRAEHRARLLGWVGLHLTVGLAVAAVVFGVLPAAVVVLAAAVAGTPLDLGTLTLPTAPWAARVLTGVAALLVAALSLMIAVAAGAAARRLAPWFLGPTWRDQWVLAQARLSAEAAHTRLARELHDGIGHALTIISVQATAARRAEDREATERGLAVIEQTARDALAGLDEMLGLLRDGEGADRRPEADLGDLDALLSRHRDAGMLIHTDLQALRDAPVDVAPIVSRVAYRIVAEGLTNAERYADRGPVRLSLGVADATLGISVVSPTAGSAPNGRRGHGLAVLAEQVRVLGGSSAAAAGPDGHWHLVASLPLRARRG